MPITITSSLLQATQLLSKTTDTPQLDSEILLSHILNQPRAYLYAHSNEILSSKIETDFFEKITQRVAGEPIAYLTGHKEFWSLDLEITKDVLIPRPETELLVELVLKANTKQSIQLADLGTGSGAIALALAHENPNWKIYATDQSNTALNLAKKNASRLHIQNIIFSQGEWCKALPNIQFDIIVSNPPYLAENDEHLQQGDLRFEPQSALVSGQDGLDAIREIIFSAKKYLKPSGLLFIEHGYQQGEKIRQLFQEAGYQEITSHPDLLGWERVTRARCA